MHLIYQKGEYFIYYIDFIFRYAILSAEFTHNLTKDKTMALTEFGKAVRKARIDAGETLLSMAASIGTSPAFLSGMETGRKKIPMEWVEKISDFFNSKDVNTGDLRTLANVSNEAIPVEGLPLKQQMLLAGFAKSAMTAEQIKKLATFLEEINNQKGDQ